MSLENLFYIIPLPPQADGYQFSALPIPGLPNHRIAKDKNGNPVLLLSVLNSKPLTLGTDFKLKNVSVLFDVTCKIKQDLKIVSGEFTVISFIGNDSALRVYFLRLCSALIESLGNEPSKELVKKEILLFIELFRLASEVQLKSVQGLWAELFIISESKDPELLLNCWHTIPEEKFDFNNGKDRLEVKSSSTGQRAHHFSLEQLYSPAETSTIIASLFVKVASAGQSIEDLQKAIVARIIGNFDLLEKLKIQIAMALGNSILESSAIKFDFYVAKESLQFYHTDSIPKIDMQTIPTSVTEVKFKSNLTGIPPISNINALTSDFFNSI